MTTPQSAAAPAGTVGAVVGQRNYLVIQGAADITTDWRDVETLLDGEYAARVMPSRLAEYQRGDCHAMRFTEYRMVWRTVTDRSMPNTRPVRTDGPQRDSGTHEAVVGRSEDA